MALEHSVYAQSVPDARDDHRPVISLLPPFYERPRHDDPRVFLRRIESEFSILIERYSYVMDAFDHDVFIVNDELVFRFPRSERGLSNLPHEIAFLQFLRDKVAVRIPHYEWISPRGDLAGYRLVPGEVLSPWVFAKLSESARRNAADQLIGFINVIHELDVTTFADHMPRRRADFVAVEHRVQHELQAKLFPALSTDEVAAIDALYTDIADYFTNVPNVRPTHGDLYAFNIVWDHGSEQIGVLDFSDLLLGDPAKDFEVFFDYGAEYAAHAYENYVGPHDDQFLERAELYYKTHAVYTLLSSRLGALLTFEHARKRFREKFGLDPV